MKLWLEHEILAHFMLKKKTKSCSGVLFLGVVAKTKGKPRTVA